MPSPISPLIEQLRMQAEALDASAKVLVSISEVLRVQVLCNLDQLTLEDKKSIKTLVEGMAKGPIRTQLGRAKSVSISLTETARRLNTICKSLEAEEKTEAEIQST